jgi:CRP-like cAMP-binding protein
VDADRLKDLPLFSQLSKRDRKRVAPLLEELDVEAGRALVGEGDLAHELFVIEEGTAEVSREGEPIGELGAGDFFGEIALLAEDRRRTSTVTAASAMRVAVMLGHDVRVMEREMPDVARQIRAAMAARVAQDQQR